MTFSMLMCVYLMVFIYLFMPSLNPVIGKCIFFFAGNINTRFQLKQEEKNVIRTERRK